MAKYVSEKIKMKSGARLAAVQACYMAAFGQLSVDEVIEEFIKGEDASFIVYNTESGNSKAPIIDLTPVEIKNRFMDII